MSYSEIRRAVLALAVTLVAIAYVIGAAIGAWWFAEVVLIDALGWDLVAAGMLMTMAWLGTLVGPVAAFGYLSTLPTGGGR